MSINDEFQPKFYGLLGSGAGQHSASRSERFDHNVINRLENAVWQLWSMVEGQGHYGPFVMETTSGYTEDTFTGDGTTQTFTLSAAISKEMISGYSIYYDNPYASGISHDGILTGFSTSTNLSQAIYCLTAPPAGETLTITYMNITKWPSAVNSSAYLLPAELT